jgi:fatty acid desaturase
MSRAAPQQKERPMSSATMTSASATTTAPRRGISGPTLLILGILLALIVLVAAAVMIGPVVLTMAALVLVPVMFILFLAISRP